MIADKGTKMFPLPEQTRTLTFTIAPQNSPPTSDIVSLVTVNHGPSISNKYFEGKISARATHHKALRAHLAVAIARTRFTEEIAYRHSYLVNRLVCTCVI